MRDEYDSYDDMDTEDLFTPGEMQEAELGAELHQDAIDEARYATEED